jgi:putative ABC transport system substrate-binding protein
VLRELGYVEGKDIVTELRTADSVPDRIPGLVAELLSIPVDILVSQGTATTRAAKAATSTVPIVFVRVADPVQLGVVASLARPGGNVTGTAAATTGPKQLEILKETIPGLRRVAVLWHADNPGIGLMVRETEVGARSLGLELQVIGVRTTDELDAALETIARSHPDALLVVASLTVQRGFNQVPDFATKIRLPQMYSDSQQYVGAGAMMFVGGNLAAASRDSAALVDRIFKGAKPADLPVALPTQIDFIVNLATAARIGLAIPDSVLRQASEIRR